MGLVSNARANSAATNAAFHLRAAAGVVPCVNTPNYLVMGTCGHALVCIRPADVDAWRARIAAGRRHRRRCEDCPR